MKLMASGVILSAAIVRSPSFSRSSSSTTITIFPARIAPTASSMEANGPRRRAPFAIRIFGFFVFISARALEHALQVADHVLPDHVALEVHAVSGSEESQRRVFPRMRHQHDVERRVTQGGDRQADAV